MKILTIILFIISLIFLKIEIKFQPRIYITKKGDVLLWYSKKYYKKSTNEWFISRQFKYLFKIYK